MTRHRGVVAIAGVVVGAVAVGIVQAQTGGDPAREAAAVIAQDGARTTVEIPVGIADGADPTNMRVRYADGSLTVAMGPGTEPGQHCIWTTWTGVPGRPGLTGSGGCGKAEWFAAKGDLIARDDSGGTYTGAALFPDTITRATVDGRALKVTRGVAPFVRLKAGTVVVGESADGGQVIRVALPVVMASTG